jgi:hypothetical protein
MRADVCIMYVCIYVCMYVGRYVCMYVCMCVYVGLTGLCEAGDHARLM